MMAVQGFRARPELRVGYLDDRLVGEPDELRKSFFCGST